MHHSSSVSRLIMTSKFPTVIRPLLAAFDFDHTIVDDNTDIVVRKLLPEEKLPNSVRNSYRSEGWTWYMGKIFELLHQNSIGPDTINAAIDNIPAVAGMEKLLSLLRLNDCDIIIISDSNSIFIERWLKHNKLDHLVSCVFTNPAKFDKNGLLKIQMYHHQDWCDLSEKNLCKGHILDTYIEDSAKKGISYNKIAYFGDGRNDLCPMLRLSNNDLVFPRLSYALVKILDAAEENQKHKLKAEISRWHDATDILRTLSERVDGFQGENNHPIITLSVSNP